MEKYHMRRKELQITDENELEQILTQGKYIMLAMCRDNEPYIVTLSYGYDKRKNVLYFHTALKGLKIDFINSNPNVCGTIIEDRGYVMGQCNHKYRSLVINGKVSFVEDLEEKKYGMEVLLDHLEDNPTAIKERSLKNEEMYNNIAILRLDIEDITGKIG